jgi:hypothetical protein
MGNRRLGLEKLKKMQFNLDKTLEILERTPSLEAMLHGLSGEWTNNNEGPQTWSPFDVVEHLVHGEKTDWIPRMEIVLSDGANKSFEPFDRFAQFRESEGKTLHELLEEFKRLRKQNVERLRSRNLTPADYSKKGIHPDFGEVTLSQLLATWTVHDLNHIGQIVRVMANQYKIEVGRGRCIWGY